MNEKEITRIAKRLVGAPVIWDQTPFKIEVHPGEENEKHKSQHLHVTYQKDKEGSVEISSGTQLAGGLPPRALKLIREWLSKHRESVLEMLRNNRFYRIDRTIKKSCKLFAGTILAAEPIEDYCVIVAFDDGTVKLFDCKPPIFKYYYFEKLRNNPELFKKFKINHLGDEIFWEEDADMAFPADWMHDSGIDLI